MDPSSIATAVIATSMAKVQLAVAAKIMRMNAGNEAAVAQLIDAADRSAATLANVAEGIGRNLDVTA